MIMNVFVTLRSIIFRTCTGSSGSGSGSSSGSVSSLLTDSSTLTTGAIIGMVVGSLAGLAVLIAIIVVITILCKRKKITQVWAASMPQQQQQQQHMGQVSMIQGAGYMAQPPYHYQMHASPMSKVHP